MRKYLDGVIAAKNKKIEELRAKIKTAETADEVRALGETLDAVLEELQAAKDTLAKMDENDGNGQEGREGQDGQESGQRSAAPAAAETRGGNPMASYRVAQRGAQPDTEDLEYRTAFMNLVLHNTPIPANVRADASTTTTDAASVIPTVLVNRIIEQMENCGMILSQVTRTSYAAGVVIPTSTVKPVASWVAEGATSDRQKKTTGKITFSYFKLRCEISMSMEVGTMALSAFEAKFVENVSNAMVIAIEKAILSGNGTSQPKGILKETPAGTLEIAAAVPTYKELCAAEAMVPAEYEGSAKWCMTKAQFMNFVSMTDSNGQPVARVNYGINGKPERILLGREVIVHPYATEMGTTTAFIADLKDYVLNTIYDMGISKKQDWDTEDLLTKAVMSCDGKMISTSSLVTLTVKSGT